MARGALLPRPALRPYRGGLTRKRSGKSSSNLAAPDGSSVC